VILLQSDELKPFCPNSVDEGFKAWEFSDTGSKL
jgi:hypothetical protein